MKNIVKPESLKKQDARETARKELKKTFEDRYEPNTHTRSLRSLDHADERHPTAIWRSYPAVLRSLAVCCVGFPADGASILPPSGFALSPLRIPPSCPAVCSALGRVCGCAVAGCHVSSSRSWCLASRACADALVLFLGVLCSLCSYLNRGKNTGGVQYFFQKLRF